MDEQFLLTTPLAQRLFHDCAKALPIIDYHNHLAIRDLLEGRQFQNLAQLWIVSDPYKHRAMRICGVDENRISGDVSDYEKYRAWMETLPKLLGNALYDWSILEMKRIFDIDLVPGVTDPDWLWQETNRMLSMPGFRATEILERFGVEYAAPCAGASEDVSAYAALSRLAPSLRGDDLVPPTLDTIRKLEALTGISISDLSAFCQAVIQRLDDFGQVGCRFADHALDDGFAYFADDGGNEARFSAILRGETLPEADRKALSSQVLCFLAGEYAVRGWTMQLHIGAQRFTSSRLRKLVGPAGGFAGIGNSVDVQSLTGMLDAFEQNENGMPRIILFTLNPADNAVMSILSGSYVRDGRPGNVQQGPAWWWCDHLQGMREVFDAISAYGVLWVFIGMTTDSRSILSFVRHEYFRRAFCGWIGEKVARGELPEQEASLRALVENVCYYNAKRILEEGGVTK